ncbi:bifunctional [glutamate--ammonia ligase]-adenylyl-L-tyrosine phosphorylase/[glutamate--ammonia-ligase] adenylyltransferase [Fimbriiglobus ruber]|uniref:Glutamate-ammonia-ligase adenylyltransferase n=1 Tax=Fimbriiglobus ruber TaxID=1908690 RepID=A0A225DJS4_9BACT|nr:bifunctional [glutamate--ammonia ligase]-adenylyl-L-tyrosine phosphorylase/[glutamate--ammonia-ligase] adenylyltransferase [Fimbriiglobus ruber]OWK41710.1 Glutamate-ammonia-ligase adenylyltransferase [Fimbriiglobus ruber]
MLSTPLPDALRDPARGRRNLDALVGHLGADRAAAVGTLLGRLLPRTADPDMALNNLERLFAQPPARDHLPGLLEARGRALEGLLHLLATSQFFADTLAAYPEAIESVRQPPRRNPSTAELTAQLRADVDATHDDHATLRAIRRFRQLQMLRIGVNDVIRDRPLEEVTRDLARVADACVEVGLQTALRTVGKKFGQPMAGDGREARLAALAFGKLGGDELNYSSDIDLMFVYDHDGETSGKRSGSVPNSEFFARVVTELVRLLSVHTDRGFAYRVDLRLRPSGQRGPLARPFAGTLSYYDAMGRTWERQALIKVRPVAGDLALGREFVKAVEPFVYRKYFSFSEINEVKALKRQMEHRTTKAGADDLDVKTGRGGIRDIEYTVQFLQLLNGGDLPAVRQRNTLMALEALEIAGCLTAQETYILADAYRFLRKTEHRLQLLFDWQTHKLPTSADELRKLARRTGYEDKPPEPTTQPAEAGGPTADAPPAADAATGSDGRPLAAQKRSLLDESPTPTLDTRALLVDPLDHFLKDYHDKTRVDRAILDHLLHQTFAEGDQRAEPESDLILIQDPDDATIRSVLGRYPFRDVPTAYLNLMKLAQEEVPFLSHRRCRHFLASIAPQLLRAVADTPDPDLALNNLERVTASLGGKAVLYELFSSNPPSLKLYVDICASSPYLSGILTNNPGMADELLDSLVLDQPRTADELRSELAELRKGASDLDPILHSFQDKELVRIGVRDLLGKDTVRQTTAALSDLADTILNAVFDLVEPTVRAKYGEPTIEPASPGNGKPAPCRYVVLGLGKLGGREISYHSDLDLVVVYEGDGMTTRGPAEGGPDSTTTNFHFFTELSQRAIKALSQSEPLGRLYAVDMRLRPTGKSGSLVVPLAEFRRYFAGASCQLWERQSLTRSRAVRGAEAFADEVTQAVRAAVLGRPWAAKLVDEIRTMRDRLEANAGPRNLKRGPGGLVDIEFLVQLLQLKYGREHPEILRPNLWDALDAIAAAGLLPRDEAAALREGYSFLRMVEARLRIVTDRPLTEIPESAEDREKLARRLGFDAQGGKSAADRFAEAHARVAADVRRLYRTITDRERTP